MAVPEHFVNPESENPSSPSSSCSNCHNCPSLDVESIGSYEEGWDDHEGPCWDNPLDAESVARQASLPRNVVTGLKRAPSRCKPRTIHNEESRGSRSSLSIEADVPCPPDIEEIDLYMPAFDHKWMSMYNAPEARSKLNGTKTQQENEQVRLPRNQARRTLPNTSRSTKGCGYSCQLHDIRRSGLGKPRISAADMAGWRATVVAP